MATYNGQRYLDEQLESLLAQDHLPAELVVGDDGSVDETLAILEAFAARAPFPVRVTRNQNNVGPADNFLLTAGRCLGPVTAFCDQDDVWLPCKISRAVEALSRTGASLVLQRAELVGGSDPGSIYPTYLPPGAYPLGSLYGLQDWPGFLMTFHSSLVHRFSFGRRPPYHLNRGQRASHDAWVFMLALNLGTVLVLPEVVARYRRHASTVTGDNLDRRDLRAKVSDSLAVLPAAYEARARCAFEMAEYLEEVGGEAFIAARRRYQRMGRVLRARSELVASPSRLDRLRLFTSLVFAGGYLRPRSSALPVRSLVKDGFMALFGRLSD